MKALFALMITIAILIPSSGCGRAADSKADDTAAAKRTPTSAEEPEGGWPSPLLRGTDDTSTTPASADATADGESEQGEDPPRKAQGEISEPVVIALGGNLKLTAPKGWERVKPRIGMIQYELRVPAAEGDKEDGRVTVMTAGGSVDANVERWYGQFKQPDGSKTAEKAKREEKEIAGTRVVLVDIAGTYQESRGGGPFAPGPVVELPDYRMLAAIVVAPDAKHFIKFYGPAKTVAREAEAFRKMVEGLEAK